MKLQSFITGFLTGKQGLLDSIDRLDDRTPDQLLRSIPKAGVTNG
jgi:hypothetical protein